MQSFFDDYSVLLVCCLFDVAVVVALCVVLE